MIAVCWGKPRPNHFTVDEKVNPLAVIIQQVARKYRVTCLDLLSDRRSRYVAWPRQEVMYRAYTETTMSLPAIGRHLGGRDHTTVMHGIKQHKLRMETQP
jgi:chromosomal replication initiator protein